MQIYINSPGTYLRVHDGIFQLEQDGQKTRISPKKVKTFVISTKALITTDAIALAVQYNIDIVLLDDFGNPYGRFWHSGFGSTATIRRKQTEIFGFPEGLELAKEWLAAKIENALNHLSRLAKKRPSRQKEIDRYREGIVVFLEKIKEINGTPSDVRNSIMAYEGNAGRIYYEALAALIPKGYVFEGRSSRPARDFFNCMLNYGFGILYSKVERACVIAGLDPNTGILHTDNYNKRSLVFDWIEAFRYLAIEPTFRLFTRKQVNKSFFDAIKGGYLLNKEGKKILVEAMSLELSKKIVYRGRKVEQENIIQLEAHRIANKLIEE